MSKVDNMLKVLKANVGQWCCAVCASNSGQPAATFREIKKMGYRKKRYGFSSKDREKF